MHIEALVNSIMVCAHVHTLASLRLSSKRMRAHVDRVAPQGLLALTQSRWGKLLLQHTHGGPSHILSYEPRVGWLVRHDTSMGGSYMSRMSDIMHLPFACAQASECGGVLWLRSTGGKVCRYGPPQFNIKELHNPPCSWVDAMPDGSVLMVHTMGGVSLFPRCHGVPATAPPWVLCPRVRFVHSSSDIATVRTECRGRLVVVHGARCSFYVTTQSAVHLAAKGDGVVQCVCIPTACCMPKNAIVVHDSVFLYTGRWSRLVFSGTRQYKPTGTLLSGHIPDPQITHSTAHCTAGGRAGHVLILHGSGNVSVLHNCGAGWHCEVVALLAGCVAVSVAGGVITDQHARVMRVHVEQRVEAAVSAGMLCVPRPVRCVFCTHIGSWLQHPLRFVHVQCSRRLGVAAV